MGIQKISTALICLLISFSFSQAQLLSAEVVATFNSTYDEQHPVLSVDGNYLFITRSNHPQNVGGLKDPGDIWIAHFNGAVWGPLVHGGAVLNDRGYNTVIGTSPDNQQLFIANHVTTSAEPAKTQGIAVAIFNGSTWTNPTNVSIPYFHTRSSFLQGSLSRDGQHFVYAAETYGTAGVEDIYVVSRELGSWSEPKNLGTTINTSFQELSPSLNSTKDTLFFSSNGRKGQGSFDVYFSARLDDSWQRWSVPENMSTINTEGRDLSYVRLRNGDALYTSTINSDGYGDIKLHLSGKPEVKDTITVPVVITPPVVSDQLRLKGRVLDAKTSQGIAADLLFTSATERESRKANRGLYEVVLAGEQTYHVTIEAEGYISSYQTLNLTENKNDVLEVDFRLQAIEVGVTVNLKNVLFKQSSTELLPESKEELDVVVSFMRTNPKVKISLAGHTDNRGVHKDNVKLSQARVEKVKDYLVSKGIAAKRISGKGYGGIKPIANNDSDESRKLNRRVEFTIVKN